MTTLINTTASRPAHAVLVVPLTAAEISGLVPNAVCGYCWAPHLQPCDGVPAGSFHAARLTRLTRSGLITAADKVRVLAAAGNPAATPGTVITVPAAP